MLEDTLARNFSNLFGISLAYSYLCTQILSVMRKNKINRDAGSLCAVAMVAMLTLAGCGNKTSGEAPVADSTEVVNEVQDSLNTVEAVVRQVNAVYDYLNELREHYDENKPSLDERFGSKEWQRVRKMVEDVDRECECGGFFDFGDEGPLNAWVYDCFEGAVSANDIKAKLLSDGTAEVSFLVKDAVTTKGVPLRWLMRVEDGEWRVHNIIFVKDDNMDLLENMQAYVDYERKKNAQEEHPEDHVDLSDYAE